MAAQITRREAAAMAAGAALAASLPIPAAALPRPTRAAVAAILELHTDSWQDGSLWARAVGDHLGWTPDRARRLVKATLHDYCALTYEQFTRETWVSLFRQELDRALNEPGYDEQPDVIERGRVGKERAEA